MVDQTPVGKTSRSNPATYISVFTDIRELFAKTREAQLKGFNASFFSFNVNGGRCEACQGQGQIKLKCSFCLIFGLPAKNAKEQGSNKKF
jgi:excinuclease ABC subunit A